MSNPGLRLAAAQRVFAPRQKLPLGRLLVDAGVLSTTELMCALEKQRSSAVLLGDLLISDGIVPEDDVLDALARQHQITRVRLTVDPPAPKMAKALDAKICQFYTVVPWRQIGGTLFVAMARPEQLEPLRAHLGADAPKIVPVIANQADILDQIGRLYGTHLAQTALSRVPRHLSARGWGSSSRWRGFIAVCALGLIAACLWMWPVATPTVFLAWSVLTLAATLGLKVMAFVAQILHRANEGIHPLSTGAVPLRWPRVSVMVPLYKEKEIAGALIKRLERLTYPKHLLDVVLVLEAKDTITCETIERTELPPWMTVVRVPDTGAITTKPRALNYALDFCRGQIVGVWDAEDAPEPEQIEKVVTRFAQAPDRVACLQGMLDYYNARTNWLARCFTIEYATWWRILMPGMTRLGLVIPLGGTTLFFRRKVLEELGCWDAHNVTEDADLGVRLARAGYVTDILPTVTMEEANCRALPWVRQRSRWLKGFLITYFVHMRQPMTLLWQLGTTRFIGLQVIFLATFSQFAALPLLWLFWLPWVGFPAVFSGTFGTHLHILLAVFFLTAELLNLIIGMVAVAGPKHRHLLVWVLTMPIYFALGALAAYKALFEIVFTPHYWDKTSHGIYPTENS